MIAITIKAKFVVTEVNRKFEQNVKPTHIYPPILLFLLRNVMSMPRNTYKNKKN